MTLGFPAVNGHRGGPAELCTEVLFCGLGKMPFGTDSSVWCLAAGPCQGGRIGGGGRARDQWPLQLSSPRAGTVFACYITHPWLIKKLCLRRLGENPARLF